MSAVLSAHELTTSWFEVGQRHRSAVLAALVVALALILSRLIIVWDLAIIFWFVIVVAVGAVLVQPRYGLYLMLALALLFDGSKDDPLMVPGYFLFWSVQTTLKVTGAIIIPFELLVVLTTIAWLAHAAMRGRLDFQGGFFSRPTLLFTLALAFGVVHGLLLGGI